MKIAKATMTRLISLAKNLVTKVKVLPTKHLNSQHLFVLKSFSSLWRLKMCMKINICQLAPKLYFIPSWVDANSPELISEQTYYMSVKMERFNLSQHLELTRSFSKWTLSGIIRTNGFIKYQTKSYNIIRENLGRKASFSVEVASLL